MKPSCGCRDRGGRCDDSGCDHARLGEWTPDQCRVCWHFLNNPGIFDGTAEVILTAAPPATPPETDPKKWPLLARAVSRLRSDVDRGLGDTIQRHLARFGGEALKRFYTRLTGHDCGCGDRQAALNLLFPYSDPTADATAARSPSPDR
jgi:hypothetical protein